MKEREDRMLAARVARFSKKELHAYAERIHRVGIDRAFDEFRHLNVWVAGPPAIPLLHEGSELVRRGPEAGHAFDYACEDFCIADGDG
jgi:hypothetical protein